jgi:ArsR family transcriptional regulator, arsenate/arsenite/antimonite-responsive transcriptional repressor
MGKMSEKEAMQIAKALGDAHRFAIYSQIARSDELFCGEMSAKHTISPGTLSHHLKILTELGLITSRKEGLNVYYRTVPETFASYLSYLTSISGTRTKR